MGQVHPDPKALQYVLGRYDATKSTNDECGILRVKLYCCENEPTPLEKTMTDYELYQCGNVWWMRDLSGDNVASVYSGAEELGGKDKVTDVDFRNLSKLSDDWDVANYLDARKEHYGNNEHHTSQNNDPKW